MATKLPLISLLLLCTSHALPLFAEVYQWTDDSGAVHFSDSPSGAPNNKRTVIRSEDTASTPPANKTSVPKKEEAKSAKVEQVPEAVTISSTINFGSVLDRLINEEAS
jgi:hypothetical protein